MGKSVDAAALALIPGRHGGLRAPAARGLAARATDDPMMLAPRVREIAQRVGPDIPLTSARTLRSISDEAHSPPRPSR